MKPVPYIGMTFEAIVFIAKNARYNTVVKPDMFGGNIIHYKPMYNVIGKVGPINEFDLVEYVLHDGRVATQVPARHHKDYKQFPGVFIDLVVENGEPLEWRPAEIWATFGLSYE